MVTEEEIVEVNKRILAVSGASFDSFGFVNKGNLDYALNLANQQQNPLDQATTLMYEIIRGQPFTNANKRTGFEIGQGVMCSGGNVFTATGNEIIDFTTKINTETKSREEVKEWLKAHSEYTGVKTGFLTKTKELIEEDRELLKKLD
jgi:death-on-curing family protein